MQLGETHGMKLEVLSVYCDDNHIFCGRRDGTLGVCNLESGHLIRELGTPAEGLEEVVGRGVKDIVGSKEVIAAATFGCKVVLNGF